MPTVRKSPDAVQSIAIDWTSRARRDPDALILADGETLTGSSWTVPSGLTQGSASYGEDSSTITLSGGSPGQTYTLRCDVTTSASRAIQQTVFVEVEET
jgi:hypothetical protein